MENTDAAVAGVLEQKTKPAKADLVDVVRKAYDNTGPAALEAATLQIAERVQAIEKALDL